MGAEELRVGWHKGVQSSEQLKTQQIQECSIQTERIVVKEVLARREKEYKSEYLSIGVEQTCREDEWDQPPPNLRVRIEGHT